MSPIPGVPNEIFRVNISPLRETFDAYGPHHTFNVFMYPANDPIRYLFHGLAVLDGLPALVSLLESAGFVAEWFNSRDRAPDVDWPDMPNIELKRSVAGRDDWSIADYPTTRIWKISPDDTGCPECDSVGRRQ